MPFARLALAVTCAATVAAASSAAPPQQTAGIVSGSIVTGGTRPYTVQQGDTLTLISARFGAEVAAIFEDNRDRLRSPDRLRVGWRLDVHNRHIVPEGHAGVELVVNVPQRMLFVYSNGVFSEAFPVAVGRRNWPTPLGPFTVMARERNPVWDVPVSIQEEMRRAGEEVLTKVPPGPGNPLGEYWLGLSLPSLGIHGTSEPSSIYKAISHGCLRMHPDDAARLYSVARIGMPGEVIYATVLLASSGDDILLEAHPDIYRREQDARTRVAQIADAKGIADRIDWQAVNHVLSRRLGVATSVQRTSTGSAGS